MVDWGKRVNCFDFNYHEVFNQNIQTISNLQLYISIYQRKGNLRLNL